MKKNDKVYGIIRKSKGISFGCIKCIATVMEEIGWLKTCKITHCVSSS